jgi:ABC-type sugar transport system ATPase subunit
MLLTMKNINKSFFRIPVLQNVDFELEAGEVHALVGLNGAGKTTLVNIIAGVFCADSGQMVFDGRPIAFNNPREALESGIYTIHQSMNSVPDLTVSENIFLDRLPRNRFGLIDYSRLHKQSDALFKKIGCDLDVRLPVKALNIGQLYMSELAKAYSRDAKLYIMDEPMINLTQHEKERLIAFIHDMRSKNNAIIYITHNISEVTDLCDRVTVLRDGKRIAVCETKKTTREQMSYLISGNHALKLYPPKTPPKKNVLLCADHLSVATTPPLTDITFNLHEGEILGITGLTNSGRSALIKSIYGEIEKTSGSLYLDGQKILLKSSTDALDHHFGFVSENRIREGLFMDMGIAANLTITALQKIKKGIFIDLAKESEDVVDQSIELNLEFNSLHQEIRFLSGGNQQKVLVGRSLISNAQILLLDEPTKGIDIVSRSEIYIILRELAAKGKGIILVSSDMEEIAGLCHRALVLKNGSLSAEIEGSDLASIQNYC